MRPRKKKFDLLIDRIYQLTFIVAYRLHLAWTFIVRPETHGVWIAVWSRGDLLVIKNAYRNRITLPGGSIDGGESPLIAAVRELREEVGISADPTNLKFFRQYQSRVEFKKDHINLFELELPEPPDCCPDNREVTWSAFLDPGQLSKMNLFPALREYLYDRKI